MNKDNDKPETQQTDVPAPQETVPGPTYPNPNADEHYTPPADGHETAEDGEDAGLDVFDLSEKDVAGDETP